MGRDVFGHSTAVIIIIMIIFIITGTTDAFGLNLA
jgi:hypothetical protein